MTEAFDLAALRQFPYLPEITLDVYQALPDDVCTRIEVVDGWMVRCESAEPSHQVIQHNFVAALREAIKRMDASEQTCHRVNHDVDVLIAEEPKFHFRRPDVVVHRCVEADRGKWKRRPYASDCLLVLEIVSADSVTTDLRDKRAEYAAAGIPRYWIVRMHDNGGAAISVERLLLTYNGDYIREELTVRRMDFHAVKISEPFPMKLTWEELDDGL